jgi:hypothetical protein
MIQPVAKLRFVERYCHPKDGWSVFVDIDPSEEGRTGSPRQSEQAKALQQRMLTDGPLALGHLQRIGAHVGGRKDKWNSCFGKMHHLPKGDRDIIAVHAEKRILWVAEIEGDSGGQPEGKVYKALGQLVCAVSETHLPEFRRFLSLVVWGPRVTAHLKRTRACAQLGISGLAIADAPEADDWLFGERPPTVGAPPTQANDDIHRAMKDGRIHAGGS